MTISKPDGTDEASDRPPLQAVDVAGGVWEHPNPAELYRFIRSRNELLKAIDAGRPR